MCTLVASDSLAGNLYSTHVCTYGFHLNFPGSTYTIPHAPVGKGYTDKNLESNRDSGSQNYTKMQKISKKISIKAKKLILYLLTVAGEATARSCTSNTM